jgi:excinuclease ABC subunit C
MPKDDFTTPSALADQLSHLPESPGVYLFKDTNGTIIYIGKAKVLKNRVRSYFQERHADPKTAALRGWIRDLEFIVTDNEVEALLLESHLVKKNRPRFNVNLKDDKSFPYIKLTVQEPYPRVFITRRVKKDGALYFGPYLPASLARSTLKMVHKHFLLRTCHIPIDGSLPRPCLDYHIRRCMGPCVAGLCTPDEYQRAVQDVRLFLEGKHEKLVDKIHHRMRQAAEEEHYEAAAMLRDQAQVVQALAEKQKMVLYSMDDADFFGFHQGGNRLAMEVFTLRGSRIVGRREFFWEDLEGFDPAEFLSGAVRQYYIGGSFIPCEIFVPLDFEDRKLLEEVLSDRRGQRVSIKIPRSGERSKLLKLVRRNARLAFENRFRELRPTSEALLQDLQSALKLEALPRRIECFDISNLQGTDSVGSMVLCENAEMKRQGYRKFRIKTVQGTDDFASIHEVVYRRYKRLLEEDQPWPDLILIDGGKGQLSAAARALAELGVEHAALAGIAKEEEILFVLGRADEPVRLPGTSAALHLIQKIRDEAHRFAVEFHRSRRAARDITSELLDIPGIGRKSQRELLRQFGSLKRIREARLEDLSGVVGPARARRIYLHLHETAAID